MAFARNFHRDIAIELLTAGVHVLCEKPLAISVSEAEEMSHTDKACARLLFTAFKFRFHDEVRRAKQLIETGSVTRAYLGVRLDASFGPEAAAKVGLPRPVGARVTGITASSPAEFAKFQVGDVILQFDGIRVEDDNHLINLVSLTPVSKEVDVRLLRAGQPINLRVRVGNRDEMPVE